MFIYTQPKPLCVPLSLPRLAHTLFCTYYSAPCDCADPEIMPEPCNPPCGGEHGGVRWALNAPFDEGGQALDWQDACDMIEAAYPRYTALHKRGWWRKANEYWQSLRQYHTADIVKVPLL